MAMKNLLSSGQPLVEIYFFRERGIFSLLTSDFPLPSLAFRYWKFTSDVFVQVSPLLKVLVEPSGAYPL